MTRIILVLAVLILAFPASADELTDLKQECDLHHFEPPRGKPRLPNTAPGFYMPGWETCGDIRSLWNAMQEYLTPDPQSSAAANEDIQARMKQMLGK